MPDIRLGVRLSPLKARIFDIIERAGVNGIMASELQAVVSMNGKLRSLDTIKSHIWQINEKIADEGYRIKGGGSCYVLRRMQTGG